MTAAAIETTDHDAALRPQGWADYVGQERIKRKLQVLAERAVHDDEPFKHTLFAGEAGMGKTTLARVVVNMLGEELVIVRKPLDPNQLMRLFQQVGAGVVFLDEIHLMPKASQHALLPLLEDQVFEGRYGAYEFPYLTILGATTDPDKLLAPLLGRFYVPRFEDYTLDQMADIVAAMALKLAMAPDDEMCEALAGAAGGVPRTARHLIEMARSLYVADGEMPTAEEVLDFAEIGADGLTADHVRYLAVLDQLGGQSGVANIARMLRLPTDTVLDLEPLLIRERHLIYTAGGRQLMPSGSRRHQSTNTPDPRFVPRSQRRDHARAG